MQHVNQPCLRGEKIIARLFVSAVNTSPRAVSRCYMHRLNRRVLLSLSFVFRALFSATSLSNGDHHNRTGVPVYNTIRMMAPEL